MTGVGHYNAVIVTTGELRPGDRIFEAGEIEVVRKAASGHGRYADVSLLIEREVTSARRRVWFSPKRRFVVLRPQG